MLLLSGSWSFELDDGPSNRMMVLRAGPWSFVPNDGSSSRSTAAKRGNTAKALHVGGTRMLLVSLAAVRVSAICAADLARACTLLLLLQGGVFSDDAGGGGKVAGEVSSGPVFIKEPPNRVDFSNTTGAVVECLARGNPQPEIIWVLANGNLVFTPFRAEDYRQEVHAQVYACLAKNTEGSITSRDVNVRAVVTQYYEAEVVSEYVIRGNTAVLKCNIPSFVADFVRVEAWVGSDGSVYNQGANYVVNQFYKAEILTEYVIRGNTAVLKCSIPSFVADFVQVDAWIDDQGNALRVSNDYVVSQYYVTEAENEYVIRGNSAVMKCKIPSFVADFVQVDSWIAEDGHVHKYHDNANYVVAQSYEVEADNEYVIRGNAAVMKCEVPSFVSDYVEVVGWRDSQGNSYLPGGGDYVVQQFYQSRVIDEFVLKGNTGILKCLVPSFVSDFVQIESWLADDGTIYKYRTDEDNFVVNQYYEAQVYDVFVIKGNTAVFKCQIPSFVSDHVEIVAWQDTDNNKYLPPGRADDYVVSQSYTANVMDESVLKGNTAIFKCHIPSFVSDYVQVTSWLQDDGHEILPQDNIANTLFYHLESCTSRTLDLRMVTSRTNVVRNTDSPEKPDLVQPRVD
ncbi:unnamed protein product [Callosobruchus maculatus]|uniref:Ig-like domain-containing protein n=1 Tax=Callosobruchus maculatus TaxID=64391 RepID=A0A653C8Z1_CALMS|nr:unnamed protein product [Callosobruchus maculatus]